VCEGVVVVVVRVGSVAVVSCAVDDERATRRRRRTDVDIDEKE
jgi:hypothetical protein